MHFSRQSQIKGELCKKNKIEGRNLSGGSEQNKRFAHTRVHIRIHYFFPDARMTYRCEFSEGARGIPGNSVGAGHYPVHPMPARTPDSPF